MQQQPPAPSWENDPNWGEPITDPNWGQPLEPKAQQPLSGNQTPARPTVLGQVQAPTIAKPGTIGNDRPDPKSWLTYYPGLGSNGVPNSWAGLLSSAVDEGRKNGWLSESQLKDLTEGRFPGAELSKVLTRYKGGAKNPWVNETSNLSPMEAMGVSAGRTNPLTWALYGANKLFGSNVGGIGPQGINPMGTLGNEAVEQQVGGYDAFTMLAQSLPMGVLGRLTGAAVGGTVDATGELMRQQELSGTYDPATVAAQGALGAAANFVPGLGLLGKGGRAARAAKGGATLGAYAVGSNVIANQGNENLGLKNPDGTPVKYPLMEGAPLATALGAGFSAMGPKMRRTGGKWNDPGLIGQVRQDLQAQKNQPTPPVAPVASHTPTAAPATAPAGPAADQLKAVNAKLRDLSRARAYDSQEYKDLVKEQRALQSAADTAKPAAPAEDIAQKVTVWKDELAALKASGVDNERTATLGRRIRAGEKKLGVAPAAKRGPGTAPEAPVTLPPELVAVGAEPAVPPKVAAAVDPNVPLTGTPAQRAAAMRAEDPTIDRKAAEMAAKARAAKTPAGQLSIPPAPKKGQPPPLAAAIDPQPATPLTKGPPGPAAAGAVAGLPPVPAASGQRTRIATPAVDVETMKRDMPQEYARTKGYADRIIRKMGYAAGREHLEAIIQNRKPTALLQGKPDQAIVRTTTVLSKNPRNLALVWQEAASGYEARAKAAGQSRPVEALRTVSVPGKAGPVDAPLRQTLKHHAQRLGREDLLADIDAEDFDYSAAREVHKTLAAVARNKSTAGYIPPRHAASPLSVWSVDDLNKAAASMFSTKKKPLTTANRNQVLAAGSRLMERYERLAAAGKLTQETASRLLKDATEGRIKESRMHAKGSVGLQDWLGGSGPAAKAAKPPSLAEALPDLMSGIETDVPLKGSGKRIDTLVPEEVDTLGGPKLPKVKAAAKQPKPGSEAALLQDMLAGKGPEELTALASKLAAKDAAAPPAKKTAAELMGADTADKVTVYQDTAATRAAKVSTPQSTRDIKVGEALAIGMPIGYPQDDEGDDTNTFMARLSMLGIGAVGGVKLLQRARSAWRIKGKPLDVSAQIPIAPGRSAALVHDNKATAVNWAAEVRKAHPDLAAQITTHPIETPNGPGFAVYIPNELGQNPTFVKRYTRTIEGLEKAAKAAAKAEPVAAPPSKQVDLDEVFGSGLSDDDLNAADASIQRGADYGDLPDFDTLASGGLSSADLQDAQAGMTGRKPPVEVPTFVDGEPIKPLERIGPPTRKLGDDQWLYNPKEDTRVALRTGKQKEDYYEKLEAQMARDGFAVPARQGQLQTWKTWDPKDAADPINQKLAEIVGTSPYAQPSVYQLPDGSFAISVNEHGYHGPRVRFKDERTGTMHQAHLPGGWKGWDAAYDKARQEGKIKDPTSKFVGKWGGKNMGGEVGPLREIELDNGKKVGVPDQPVSIWSGTSHVDLGKVVTALKKAFPTIGDESNAGHLKHLDVIEQGGKRHLVINRQFFEGMSAGEREYALGVAQSADPASYVYGSIDEPTSRPVGVVGSQAGLPGAPKAMSEANNLEGREAMAGTVPAGMDPLVSRAAQIRQLGQRIGKLDQAIIKETDPNRKQQFQNQRKAVVRQQNELIYRRPKDTATTGKLTMMEAVKAGFKVVETGDKHRMAEIRKIVHDAFGAAYEDHFSVGFRKSQAGSHHLMLLSPEFMQGEYRDKISRSALRRERDRLRTGVPPDKPAPLRRIVNDRVDVPVKGGELVEFATKSGIERGTVIDEVNGNVRVRTKSGGQMPIDKRYLRVVEASGKPVNTPTLRDVPFMDNDLVRPLAQHLFDKTALTNEDFDKLWRLAKDEADRRKEPAFDTLRQMYADANIDAPEGLKKQNDYGIDPFDVVQDLLWNQQRKKPSVAAQLKFARELDKTIDELIRGGKLDAADRTNARLTVLKRMVAMMDDMPDADRVEQLQSHLTKLQEAVGGLPRDPFGVFGLWEGFNATSVLASDRDPFALLNRLKMTALAQGDPDYRPPVRSHTTELVSTTRDLAYGQTMGHVVNNRPVGSQTAKTHRLNMKTGATTKSSPFWENPKLRPQQEPRVQRASTPEEITKAIAEGVDAVVFFDNTSVGRPKQVKQNTWIPLPSGTRLYAERLRAGEAPQRPVHFTAGWKAVGEHNKKNRLGAVRRVLNPTPSQIQKLLLDVAGPYRLREPNLLVIGDDGGKVDFAVKAAKTGGFDFKQAMRDLAAKLGKPVQMLTKADLKKDWRLMAALPAGIGLSASDAEASTGEDSDGTKMLKGLLPTAALLVGGIAGAQAIKRIQARKRMPTVPTGGTKIEALNARQIDQLAAQRAKKPWDLSPTGARRVLQNQFIALEKEQKKYPLDQLLPEERAWDVWSTSLGGGGGRTDAAMQRMRETVVEVRKAGLTDALHTEWNLRSNLGLVDWVKGREQDMTAALGQIKQQVAQVEAQLKAAAPQDKFKLAGQLRQLKHKEKVARGHVNLSMRAVERLNQGRLLPGGLDPQTLTAEAATLRTQINPGDRAKVQQWADRLSQEVKFVVEDMHDEGILSTKQRNALLQRGNYVNIRKAITTILTSRQARLEHAFGNPDISVATERVVKYLKDPAGLDPVHPLQGTMLWIREANQEIAQQKAARSLVQLLRLDSGNQVRLVNPQSPKHQSWLRANDMGVVSYLHDGQARHYAVPKMFAELAIAAGTIPPQAEGVMKVVRGLNTVAQSGMTWLSIPFIGANVVRDIGGARKFAPEAFKRLNPADAVKSYVEWGTAFREVLNNSVDFQTMMEEGASYSTFTKGLDPTRYLDLLEKDILGQRGPAVMVRNVKEAANAFEEATKLMTWKRLRDAGVPSLDRAVTTRRFGGSPDFWVRGSWANGLGLLHMFFNPAVQGVDQTIKGLGRKNNWAYALSGATAAVLLEDTWNQQFTDDNGKPEINHVDKQTRETNFILLLPIRTQMEDGTWRNRYLAVPKPHPAQLFHAPINAAIETYRTKDPAAARKGLSAVASKLLPLSAGVDLERPGSLVEGYMASLTPGIRLPIELARDRQYFGDRPLEGPGLQQLERSERYRSTTPTLFKDLGKLAKPLTSDGQGLSPIHLRHAIRGLSPGPVDVATDLYEQASKMLGRSEVPSARLPIVGSVARRFSGPTVGDAQTDDLRNKFYRALDTARTESRTDKARGRVATTASPQKMLEKSAQQIADLRQVRSELQQKLNTPGTDRSKVMQQIANVTKAETAILESTVRALDSFGQKRDE